MRCYVNGSIANIFDYSVNVCALSLGQKRLELRNYARPSIVIMLLMFFLLVCVSYATISSNFISLLINYDKANTIETVEDAMDSKLNVIATDFIESVCPSGYKTIRCSRRLDLSLFMRTVIMTQLFRSTMLGEPEILPYTEYYRRILRPSREHLFIIESSVERNLKHSIRMNNHVIRILTPTYGNLGYFQLNIIEKGLFK